MLLLAALLLLGLLGIAGPLGRGLDSAVGKAVGWIAILLPALLAWHGLTLLRGKRPSRGAVFGGLVTLLGAAALLHLFAPGVPLDQAAAGRFGGYVGYALAATTLYALGTIGSTLLWLAVTVAGLFITFNRPVGSLRKKPDAGDEPPQTANPTEPISAVPPASPSRTADRPAGSAPRQPEPDFQPRVVDSAWEQPPLSLLSDQTSQASAGDTGQAGRILEQTLASFGITAKVENVNVGPTVTQYELRPDAGVKLNQITALNNDIALALAAHPVRIEAPIPGKSTVGIEVPNAKAAMVRLRELFESPAWGKKGALPLALGFDVSGKPLITDLAGMPHLLIAGATGSGKSVGINTILMSLLYTHSPRNLRLLLVDPKRVELTNYNDIPHLLAPVIVEPPKVVNALKWVVSEMERRYRLFQEHGVRNLVEYNTGPGKSRRGGDGHGGGASPRSDGPPGADGSAPADGPETLPYLVVIVDELADLMAVAGKAVESTIVRIAQLARATGIHLVIATQRPSVDVITGLIKANFPSRIAFSVASATDSRTILDASGAEKLLGHGDMLFMAGNAPKPVRVQGAYVDNQEIKNLTDFLKGKGEPAFDPAVTESPGGGGGDFGDGGDDPLYDEAKAEVIRSRKASASLLQRRLKVGYARAARLLDMLEENGVIGPGEGAKPREILVEPGEL